VAQATLVPVDERPDERPSPRPDEPPDVNADRQPGLPRIVVGVDGSGTSREALRWALGLAEAFGGEVIAVHAVGLLEELHARDAPPDVWRANLRSLVETTWCAQLARAAGPHRVELHDGAPVDVLLAACVDEDARVLVLGSRGVGANPALALGSTSLQVVQSASVPVLVVPDRRDGVVAADGLELSSVLVGMDRSAPSLAALALAAEIVSAAGGSLIALEVIDYAPPFAAGPTPAAEDRADEVDRAVSETRDRGIDVDVMVRSGEPAATLIDVADRLDVDLIVVGSRGRGGPNELLLGSVARTIADRARRPTLVVPAAAGAAHLRVAADRSRSRASGAGP
jgi:nucleotide-binding universal stress UspA family protein